MKKGSGKEGLKGIRRAAGRAVAAVLVVLLLSACGKEAPETAEFVYVPEAVAGGDFMEGTFLTQGNFKVEGEYLYYLNGGIYRIPLDGEVDFEEKELIVSRDDLTGKNEERILYHTVDAGQNLYYCACSWTGMTPVLYKRGADGNQVYCVSPKETEEMSESVNLPVLAVDNEENVYLLTRNALLRFDSEGNQTGRLSLEEEIPDNTMINAYLLEMQGGKIYLFIENRMDGNRAAYEILAGDTPRLEELGENFGKRGFSQLGEGLKGLLIWGRDDWLYQYNPENASEEKLLCWQDCDVYRNHIQAVVQISEERILVLLSEIASSTIKQNLLLLTRIPAEQAVQKEQILLGSMMPSGDLEKAVVKFNQISDRYHVTIERFSEDNQGGQARLDSALASGEGVPDLLDLTYLDIVNYAEAGALEDLYPYMKEGEIKKETYLSNLLDGYTFDGKLVCIPKSFQFLGLYVTDPRILEAGDWTMEGLMAATEQYTDVGLFPDQWDYNMLSQFCGGYILEEFVDLEGGECRFDSGEFCGLLEWVRGQQTGKGEERESLMTPKYVNGFDGYQENLMMLGEDVVLRGAPLADGREAFPVTVANALGIPVKAQNQEGAWAFLQFYLQNGDAESTWSAFPTSLAMLDQVQEKIVTPLYVMMGDEVYLDKNGEPEECPRMLLYRDGVEIEVYALSQSAADALRQVLEGIDFRPRSGLEQAVIAIVEEEAGAFLNGVKTAPEVADIIQNRVRILINEKR